MPNPEALRTPGQYDELLAQSLPEEPSNPETEEAPPTTPQPPSDPTQEPRSWAEAISRVGLPEDQAFKILNEMLEKGYVERSYKIYNGGVAFTLRTRDASWRQREADALDDLRTTDPRVHAQAQMRMRLAGSLMRLNKDVLPGFPADNDPMKAAQVVRDRLAFVDRQNDAIVSAIYRYLGRFDECVYAALWVGAPTGF